ncbi:hypothetical protein MMC25_005978 [Agyrium rufum]|nr:hypothetical protein [Agyrium rufum]
MILERFDAVVFVGDSVLQTIYAAFNVLLRENLATGARLESKFESVVGTETEKKEMSQKCRCSGQVERTGCADFLVRNSDEFLGQAGRTGYHCTRTPHYLLPLTTTPTPEELQTKLTTIFDAPGPYSYKPIAIIHSLTEPLSVEMAASSLDELIDIVTSTTHASTAFLSIGPNANTIHYDSYSTALLTKRIEGDDLTDQGEIRVAGSEDTNDARQRFTWDMEKEAEIRGIDSLSMWNLTVVSGEKEKGQHESKGMDGLEVGIVQAMMVINWLSRLPST